MASNRESGWKWRQVALIDKAALRWGICRENIWRREARQTIMVSDFDKKGYAVALEQAKKSASEGGVPV